MYVNKSVDTLMQSNGDTITDQSDILSEIENLYKNLYSICDNKLHDVDIRTIVDKTNVINDKFIGENEKILGLCMMYFTPLKKSKLQE